MIQLKSSLTEKQANTSKDILSQLIPLAAQKYAREQYTGTNSSPLGNLHTRPLPPRLESSLRTTLAVLDTRLSFLFHHAYGTAILGPYLKSVISRPAYVSIYANHTFWGRIPSTANRIPSTASVVLRLDSNLGGSGRV